MTQLVRYSEPYSATGGLAAEGVINQLGRPDIEPLEVLVREAVQNCWDAKRDDQPGITVEIGRRKLDGSEAAAVASRLLVDPPLGLRLRDQVESGLELLHFADFGTSGLGGPTRADQAADGRVRDFVDFVRNIGQPPDKALGGGSYGYGKAAFFIASGARTILIDTLCDTGEGPERRFIGCALGENFEHEARPYTGRHWWGRMVDGVPEPLIGDAAAAAAALIGLPDRQGREGMGTTVVIVAPEVAPEAPDGIDATIEFLTEALVWNFWPRIISTIGGARPTITFRVSDQGQAVRLPDPRSHPRLRGFVEAMDRMRSEPEEDDGLVVDRPVECLRPIRRLGRLIIQKGPTAPWTPPDRAVCEGARQTATAVHHVALMRNAELVVKYLRGTEPATGRFGYSGVFRCAVDIDAVFRQSEPPTHDDWVYRSMPSGHDRTFVKVTFDRIAKVCQEVAGFDTTLAGGAAAGEVPLGEFADALATLLPGMDGPGARRPRTGPATSRRRRRNAPGQASTGPAASDVWVDGEVRDGSTGASFDPTASADQPGADDPPKARPPQVRAAGDPRPALDQDGAAVVRYPFEIRAHGGRAHLTAAVEVMTNDGAQVEAEAPRGYEAPPVAAWIDPAGVRHAGSEMTAGPDGVDGVWTAEVPIRDEAMMRVNIVAATA